MSGSSGHDVLIRCELAKSERGVPRLPIKLKHIPDPESMPDAERNSLVMFFLHAYAELQRNQGGPALPTGVDSEWYFEQVEPAEDEKNYATVLLLTRDTPLVMPDIGAEHRAKALEGIPALPGEVPAQPRAPAGTPPVLPPGQTPPPAPPPQPQGPQPDIRPAACGGPKCAIVNGVEAHDVASCPKS